jgi:type I restriction enzyme S subunit
VEFLYAYFKSLSVWNQIAAGSKGLGHRRQRVQPDHFLTHRLMLPPLEWQERIRRVMAEVDTLQLMQTETAAELDAMLPSILDRAFRGQLV